MTQFIYVVQGIVTIITKYNRMQIYQCYPVSLSQLQRDWFLFSAQ